MIDKYLVEKFRFVDFYYSKHIKTTKFGGGQNPVDRHVKNMKTYQNHANS